MTCFWSEFTPQHYLYCERQLCGWLQQPANTWSNIGYLLAGILILQSKQARPEKIFFSAVLLYLFVGSTFFHLSGTQIGKLLDVSAMLVFSMGVCALSIRHFYNLTQKKMLVIFFSGLALSLSFLAAFDIANIPFTIELSIAVIFEVALIREGRTRLPVKPLVLALGVQAIAVVFLALDLTKTWCEPDNHWINGHAVWHLLSAVSLAIYGTTKRESQ